MKCLIKDEELVIQYLHGKGAWTYHLVIPNTKNIRGKWGDIKVFGSIDNYQLEVRNLAPTKNGNKLLSINGTIRKAINKTGGDKVKVTLYLNEADNLKKDKHILACFNDADVLQNFESLGAQEKESIIKDIISQPSKSKQVEKILFYIAKFSF